MTNTPQKPPRKPRILITPQDHETLQALVDHAPHQNPGLDILQAELDRAVIVTGARAERPFCRIGSRVTYEDVPAGQTRVIELVLPGEADIDQGRVSILTPVGAALLGLSPGAEFGWTDDKGRLHHLRLIDVADARDPLAA